MGLALVAGVHQGGMFGPRPIAGLRRMLLRLKKPSGIAWLCSQQERRLGAWSQAACRTFPSPPLSISPAKVRLDLLLSLLPSSSHLTHESQTPINFSYQMSQRPGSRAHHPSPPSTRNTSDGCTSARPCRTCLGPANLQQCRDSGWLPLLLNRQAPFPRLASQRQANTASSHRTQDLNLLP